jgi:transposase InsO family protein
MNSHKHARLRPIGRAPLVSRVLRQEWKVATAPAAAAGVRIERVITDNGCGYLSRLLNAACVDLGLRHIRTRPYTPKTNGKVQRFVQTSLREWAYASPTPAQRSVRPPWALPPTLG